jgi:hypothetical protein
VERAVENGLGWLAKPYTADALARAVVRSLGVEELGVEELGVEEPGVEELGAEEAAELSPV